MAAMTELTGMVGFASPITEQSISKRRRISIELLAMVALAVSLMIAATAVSIGVARAATLSAVGGSDGKQIGVALLLGAVLAGMGGLTAIAARGPGSDVTESGPNSTKPTRS
jgi:hypothetical protein